MNRRPFFVDWRPEWICRRKENRTVKDRRAALAKAQENMRKTAQENDALLMQAKERAKNLIEGYIKNIGEQIGREYTVEWTDAK